MCGERYAEFLRQVAHRAEIGDAAVIDPVPELTRAESRLADLGHRLGQFFARQPDEVAPARFVHFRPVCIRLGKLFRVLFRTHLFISTRRPW